MFLWIHFHILVLFKCPSTKYIQIYTKYIHFWNISLEISHIFVWIGFLSMLECPIFTAFTSYHNRLHNVIFLYNVIFLWWLSVVTRMLSVGLSRVFRNPEEKSWRGFFEMKLWKLEMSFGAKEGLLGERVTLDIRVRLLRGHEGVHKGVQLLPHNFSDHIP